MARPHLAKSANITSALFHILRKCRGRLRGVVLEADLLNLLKILPMGDLHSGSCGPEFVQAFERVPEDRKVTARFSMLFDDLYRTLAWIIAKREFGRVPFADARFVWLRINSPGGGRQ